MIEVNGSSFALKLSNHQMNLRRVCLFRENFVELEFIFDVLVLPSEAPGPLHLSGHGSLPLDRN